MVVCVECLPADKPWDVVSVTRRSFGVAPRACVRVYARVPVPPNLYIHTYIRKATWKSKARSRAQRRLVACSMKHCATSPPTHSSRVSSSKVERSDEWARNSPLPIRPSPDAEKRGTSRRGVRRPHPRQTRAEAAVWGGGRSPACRLGAHGDGQLKSTSYIADSAKETDSRGRTVAKG